MIFVVKVASDMVQNQSSQQNKIWDEGINYKWNLRKCKMICDRRSKQNKTVLGVAIFVVSLLELASEVKSVNYVTNKMKSAMEVATERNVIKSAAIMKWAEMISLITVWNAMKWNLWYSFFVVKIASTMA